MTPELRHRRKSDDSSNGETTTAPPTVPTTTTTPITPIRRVMPVLLVSMHMAALAVVLAGLVLRFDFHSGVECNMTYAMRNFVEISSSESPAVQVYRRSLSTTGSTEALEYRNEQLLHK